MLYTEAEQFTDVVHLNRTLNELVKVNMEIESVAVIAMVVVESIKFVSDELITIELLSKLNQTGTGDDDQVTFVVDPAGFVTINGSASVKGVPIR